MSELRKKWNSKHLLDQAKLATEKKFAAHFSYIFFLKIIFNVFREELEKITLHRAMKLRQMRSEVAVGKEKLDKLRLDAKERKRYILLTYTIVLIKIFIRERIAISSIRIEQHKKLQQQRYLKLIKELSTEKVAWLNHDNLETKINEQLFIRPSATGLLTAHSNHWRYHLFTMNFKRILSPEFIDTYLDKVVGDRMSTRGHIRSVKNMIVEDILDPMIGTGSERAKYKELVEKFSKVFDARGGLDSVDEYLEYVRKIILI